MHKSPLLATKWAKTGDFVEELRGGGGRSMQKVHSLVIPHLPKSNPGYQSDRRERARGEGASIRYAMYQPPFLLTQIMLLPTDPMFCNYLINNYKFSPKKNIF